METPQAQDCLSGGASDSSLLENGLQDLKVQRQPQSWFRCSTRNWWLFEISLTVLGTAPMLLLVNVLSRYDGRTAPRLNIFAGQDTTLNTFGSVLSVIGRASLVWAVSEGLSQSKWMWYQRDRSLDDMSTFDEASRGAWGGFVLLYRLRFRHISSVGAALMIFGLAIDPLSQALVLYELRAVNDLEGTAQLMRATYWSHGQQGGTYSTSGLNSMGREPPLPMMFAVLSGLYAQNSLINHTRPLCSSGDCTWDTYETLAVCSRTANISHAINVDATGSVTLGGLTLNGASLELMRSAAVQDRINSSVAFAGAEPIVDVLMIYRNGTETSLADYNAMEFVLEWCVLSIATEVVNGEVTNSILDTRLVLGIRSISLNTKPTTNKTYEVADLPNRILSAYLSNLFNGTVSALPGPNTGQSISSEVVQALYQPFNAENALYYADRQTGTNTGEIGLARLVANMATSMTNIVRNPDFSVAKPGTDGASIDIFKGNARQYRSFVSIQWGWIAAHLTFTVGSLIFIWYVVIMAMLQHSPIWKSATLAVLQGLEEELHRDLGGMQKLAAMQDTAKGVRVRLEKTSRSDQADTWRLVKVDAETAHK